ncbi:molybdopterin molybdotransferase MoeA [Yunchengibacter salinarum]|uniref:molybdopterin molybdotransferase MoeA n=1 Tax=Yunchengibacter salinarum TaxID=3133399 RepID=UPI0035B68DFB
MIPWEDAFERMMADVRPLESERVALAAASGRVLVAPLRARRDQPALPMSAMDGYAVASADLSGDETRLPLTGESRAGRPAPAFTPGTAMRIFTGAPMPAGTDQVVIQENAIAEGDHVRLADGPNPGRHVRGAAIDFHQGGTVLEAGTYLTPRAIGLAAAAGHDPVMVHRQARVAILATGDELIDAGQNADPHQTVNSNAPMLATLFTDLGAHVLPPERAGDRMDSLASALEKALHADLVLTIGGASVGTHDLVRGALEQAGVAIHQHRVAMRPGKPVMTGRRGRTHVIGLPGNPVSAYVTARLFACPLVDRLMGRPAPRPQGIDLPVACALPANGPRDHFIRAELVGEPGSRKVAPLGNQDSSLLSVLAQAHGLLHRPAGAPAVETGDPVPFLPL